MTTPANVTLPSFVRGDTWDGIDEITITVNDAAPPYPLASAKIEFRKGSKTGDLGHTLSTAPQSGDGIIQVADAALWKLIVPPQDMPLTAAIWHYDIQTTDSQGTVKTYIAGTVTVEQDVTQ